MPEKSIGNVVISTCFESVPSPNDPANANEFYEALGIATIAWGRLEGNFNNVFVMVLNIADDPRVGNRLYIKRDKVSEIWTLAFEITPILEPFKHQAKAFLSSMEELSNMRDMLSHGLWGPWVSDSPLTMSIAKLKPRDSIDGMWYSKGQFSVNEIRWFIGQINHLNSTLYYLSDRLTPLRGGAPPDARRL